MPTYLDELSTYTQNEKHVQVHCNRTTLFVALNFVFQFDPNGRQCLSMAGFRLIGQLSRLLSDQHSNGRLLVVQEGGYHVTYSAYCLHATLEGVLNLPDPLLADPIAYYPEDKGFTVEVVNSIKQHWKDNIPFLKEI